ncbi:MAG: acetamidase/formamidase family protein [Firmicutes bacterium]|nr:acetamidase/formamidase family protein [Bacillota bacterium]
MSFGDPHGPQGDGEINGTAIEASLDMVVEVRVRKGWRLGAPLLETPDAWISHGFHTDLDQATRDAILAMLDFLCRPGRLSREDAYTLISVAGDVAVTQVVDQRQGVHVLVPKRVFPPDAEGDW